jgi:vitamin B12 transporter
MKKRFLVLTAVFISSIIQAQTPQDTIVGEIANVTASKITRKQNETGKVVTVITKATLQNNASKTISEIISQQAGVFIAGSNNNAGSNQDVYLRGTGKVLFLLDGQPLYDASTINNSFDINSIQVESLERIEILKGAQSTLYGSDAVGGVINLITIKNNAANSSNIHINYGSFGTLKTNIGTQGNADGTQYNVQLTHYQTNGISAAYDSIGNQNFDNDKMQQTTFNGTIGGDIAPNAQMRFTTQLSTYAASIDGDAFTDDTDFKIKNRNANFGLQTKIKTHKGNVHFNLSYNTASRSFLNDSTSISSFILFAKEKYIGRSFFADLYTTQKLHKNIELTAGADYRKLNSDQDYSSLSAFGPYDTKIVNDSVQQNMLSAYASILLHTSNGFYTEIGARYNKHSSYGNNTTFTINPSYSINNNWRIFANASSAFKAPSLYQLFGPGVENRKLKAEKSLTLEAGMQYIQNNNSIDYNLNTFTYFNNNTQKDKGIELEAETTIGKFKIAANYTYLTGKVNTWKFVYNPTTYSYDIKGDTTYNNLFRRPKHNANIVLTYNPTKSLQLQSIVKYVGDRYEGQFLAAPISLKSYTTIDLNITYLFANKSRIYADLRNLTNTKYYDVWGYNTRPNNFTVGFQIIF